MRICSSYPLHPREYSEEEGDEEEEEEEEEEDGEEEEGLAQQHRQEEAREASTSPVLGGRRRALQRREAEVPATDHQGNQSGGRSGPQPQPSQSSCNLNPSVTEVTGCSGATRTSTPAEELAGQVGGVGC